MTDDIRKAWREKSRRAQRSAERIECPVHSFQRHGREAEELRRGIEDLIVGYSSVQDEESALTEVVRDLQMLLKETDARDSLAYLERLPNKRTTQAPRNAPEDK